MMNRRAFVGGVSTIVGARRAAIAQPAAKVSRIGVLSLIPLTTLEASSVSSLSKVQGRSSAEDPGQCGVDRYGALQWAFCKFGM